MSGSPQYQVGDVGAGATVLQGEHLSVIINSVGAAALQDLARAAGSIGPLADKINELSQKLGVTQGAMRTMLATVGQADVPDEHLTKKLAEVIARYREATATIAALHPDNLVAQEHVAKASKAAALGDRDEARRQLQAARQADIDAAEQARRFARDVEAAATEHMLQAARAATAEAELVRAALDYPEAARLFAEAATLLPTSAPDEQGLLLCRQAEALQRQSEERSDGTVLQQAIAACMRALELLPRERYLHVWGIAQKLLGDMLQSSGVREVSMARLKQAVEAYRELSDERAYKHYAPFDWAAAHNNLGNTLVMLSIRDPETAQARLEQAVKAYRTALEELSREPLLLQCVQTQINLGHALMMLGWREDGTVRLQEAVAAFEACLSVAVSVLPPKMISNVRLCQCEAQAEIERRMAH